MRDSSVPDLEAHEHSKLKDVKSGDLLAWKGNSKNKRSDWFIRFVAWITRSQYGHVGIAWRYGDKPHEVLAIEAALPAIKVSTICLEQHIDVVPMGIEWSRSHRTWLLEKLDKPYSWIDAFRAFFGKKLDHNNDQWQCAEFCHWFYEDHGIKLVHDFTPSGVVSAALTYRNAELKRVTD